MRLAYQNFGARTFKFLVEINGWELSGEPVESGGLVDQDQITRIPKGYAHTSARASVVAQSRGRILVATCARPRRDRDQTAAASAGGRFRSDGRLNGPRAGGHRTASGSRPLHWSGGFTRKRNDDRSRSRCASRVSFSQLVAKRRLCGKSHEPRPRRIGPNRSPNRDCARFHPGR